MSVTTVNIIFHELVVTPFRPSLLSCPTSFHKPFLVFPVSSSKKLPNSTLLNHTLLLLFSVRIIRNETRGDYYNSSIFCVNLTINYSFQWKKELRVRIVIDFQIPSSFVRRRRKG